MAATFLWLSSQTVLRNLRAAVSFTIGCRQCRPAHTGGRLRQRRQRPGGGCQRRRLCRREKSGSPFVGDVWSDSGVHGIPVPYCDRPVLDAAAHDVASFTSAYRSHASRSAFHDEMTTDPHFWDLILRELWLLLGVIPILCATVADSHHGLRQGKGVSSSPHTRTSCVSLGWLNGFNQSINQSIMLFVMR